MTFQPKRRFSHMFNRNQKIRKNRIDQNASKENLLCNNAVNSERYDSSKNLQRSAFNKRHLNSDGSSCEELKELCKKLPRESIMTTPAKMSYTHVDSNESI